MNNKKGYLHIAEYDLTKKILDELDIDIEDEFELVDDMEPLYYKDKPMVLPSYERCINYMSDGVIFRPFSNINHANYLFNLVCVKYGYEMVFDYKDGDNDSLDGSLKIIDPRKNTSTVNFHGIKNQAVLLTTLLMKLIMSSGTFSSSIKSIFKIDKKISDKHKPEGK